MSSRITVVINCHAHERYVAEAIQSACDQKTDYEFEVLIACTRSRPELEGKIQHIASGGCASVRPITVPDASIGEMLAAAAQESKNDIIAILDDDDTWELSKIEAVGRAFENPQVSYFHNSQTFVDQSNAPLSPLNLHRLIRHPSSLRPEGRTYIVDTADPVSVGRVRPLEPDFNNSSISIRRELLANRLDALKKVRRGEDTFLYYCALASRGKLFLTTDRLTRYRIHSGAVTAPRTFVQSAPADPQSYVSFTSDQYDRLEQVRDESFPLDVADLEGTFAIDQAFWATLRSASSIPSDRAGTRRRIRSLLGNRFVRPRPRELLVAGLALAAWTSPRLARGAVVAWRRLW